MAQHLKPVMAILHYTIQGFSELPHHVLFSPQNLLITPYTYQS